MKQRYKTPSPPGTQAVVRAIAILKAMAQSPAQGHGVTELAVSLGVNQGGGISFTNENPAATVTEARKKAVADAMDKARTLAEAAGVSLGRVLEISDQNTAPSPMPIEAKAFDRAAAPAVPVQAGENSYKVQVNITFELK